MKKLVLILENRKFNEFSLRRSLNHHRSGTRRLRILFYVAKAILILIMIQFLILNFTLDMFAKSNEEIEKELDEIIEELPSIRNNVKNSYGIKNISIWGGMRYYFEYLHEQVSPGATNKAHIFERPDNNNANLFLNFRYDSGGNFTLNYTLYLDDMMLDDDFDKVIGPGSGEFFITTWINTRFGNFNFELGGPRWGTSSAFTFSSTSGDFKRAPFDREPWSGITSDYAHVITSEVKTVEQRSEGSRGIKGILTQMDNLPGELNGKFFFGKFEDTAWNSYDLIHWGKLERSFFKRSHTFGLAYATYIKNPSNIEEHDIINNTYALIFKGRIFFRYEYYVETAFSTVKIPEYSQINGEAGIVGLSTTYPKVLFLKRVPISLSLFTISPDFYGGCSSVSHAYQTIPIWDEQSLENPLPSDSALYNNRWGGSMKSGFDLLGGKFTYFLGHSKNYYATTNVIQFRHDLDNWVWAKLFQQFNENAARAYSTEGMSADYWDTIDSQLGNLEPEWSSANEKAIILDRKKYKRYYGIFSFNYGYHITKLFPFMKRTYWCFNSYFKSTDNTFNFFPSYTKKNLIWGGLYETFMAWGIFSDFNLIGYYAIETWVSEVVNPLIDQKHVSWGIGGDYIITSGSIIFLRFKKYKHFDYIREDNYFKGMWMSFEIKTSF